MWKPAPLLLALAARYAHGELDGAAPSRAAAEAAARGQLLARPGRAADRARAGATGGDDPGPDTAATGSGGPGLMALGLGEDRDGVLYAPPSYRPARPAPLVLMLHGAGGSGARALALLRPLADASGLLVLSPDSRGPTWDAVGGAPGPDVRFIDRALRLAFARYRVDDRRVFIAGFSDGASYALGLGLGNGDLFAGVAAFSPGLLPDIPRRGAPRVFLSHGTEDRVLPIDVCSRRIALALEAIGLAVRYVEFPGPHAVPEDIARQGLRWLLR